MARLVGLIGSGIGLAQEIMAVRREGNAKASSQLAVPEHGESSSSVVAQPPQYIELPDEQADRMISAGQAVPIDLKHVPNQKVSLPDGEVDDNTSSEEEDKKIWELCDAAEAQMSRTASIEVSLKDAAVLVEEFIKKHHPPAYTPSQAPQGKLPCAVIIPQRRPGDKKRGFVRAYAPVLNDCGIDQMAFLDFLKTFHKAAKSNPYLQVINMAAMITGFVPGVITMGVSIGVSVAVGVAMEVQARSRSNTFLDRVNKDFFIPHGLYCLILTYKPDSTAPHSSVNITQAIQSSTTSRDSGMKNKLRNLRLTDGKVYGELELPEAAPLIFPALESLIERATPGEIQKSNKLKSSLKWFADYTDRRAQAKYAAENPDSVLAAGPEGKRFASRFSDPSHPVMSGSLVSLVTGGKINPRARNNERRARRRVNQTIRRGEPVTEDMRQGKGKSGFIGRMLKEDVIYMMIVNMPTEEDLVVGRPMVVDESH